MNSDNDETTIISTDEKTPMTTDDLIKDMSNKIFEIKDKLTDGEFKNLMEVSKKIYEKSKKEKMVKLHLEYTETELIISDSQEGTIHYYTGGNEGNISYSITDMDSLTEGSVIQCKTLHQSKELWFTLFQNHPYDHIEWSCLDDCKLDIKIYEELKDRNLHAIRIKNECGEFIKAYARIIEEK